MTSYKVNIPDPSEKLAVLAVKLSDIALDPVSCHRVADSFCNSYAYSCSSGLRRKKNRKKMPILGLYARAFDSLKIGSYNYPIIFFEYVFNHFKRLRLAKPALHESLKPGVPGLNSKTLSAFCSSALDDVAAANSCHAAKKSMGSCFLDFTWLISSFHFFYPLRY